MPVTTELIEDGRIVYLRTSSPWTIEETFEAYKVAESYFDRAACTLHSLIDVREVTSVPTGVMRVRNTPFLNHKSSGYMAVVGAKKLARTVAETILKISNFKRAKFFETQEEALTYLKQLIADEATG